MKLQILAALGVLTLAGAAAAQVEIYGQERQVVPRQAYGPPPVQDLGSHWTNPELWDGYQESGPVLANGAPILPTTMTLQVAQGLRSTVPRMRQACAADQQSLCADKKEGLAADRCLQYHRLKLSSPCKQAWDDVTKAAEGRL